MNLFHHIALLSAGLAAREAVPTPSLLEAPTRQRVLEQDAPHGIARSRPLVASAADLAAAIVRSASGKSAFELELFDGEQRAWELSPLEPGAAGTLVAYGKRPGSNAISLNAVLDGDRVTVSIWGLGGAHTIQRSALGGLELVQHDPRHEAGCADRHEAPPSLTHSSHGARPQLGSAWGRAQAGHSTGGQADTAVLIDVMFLFTSEARTAAEAVSSMTGVAQTAITSGNTAFQNSLINATLRSAGAFEVVDATLEAGATGGALPIGRFSTLVENLANPTDGVLDQVPGLRDANAADLVFLITSLPASTGFGAPTLGGISYRQNWYVSDEDGLDGFAVVDDGSLTASLTFAHQLGHLMGANQVRPFGGPVPGHRGQGASGAFPWAHGHIGTQYQSGSVTQWRTIMVDPVTIMGGVVTRVPYYSNPDVSYDIFNGVGVAQPTGVDPEDLNSQFGHAESAFNAAVLGASSRTVSNYR